MSVYKRYADMPGQILYRDGTAAAPEDYEQFSREVARLPMHTTASVWLVLLNRPPAVRLKANMSVISAIMVDSDVRTVIPEGITLSERNMLEALVHLNVGCQLVGHELLNLRERQLFVDHFRIIFSAYRCKGGASNGQEEG